MLKSKSLLGFMFCSLLTFLWVYRGYRIGEEENEINKKQHYTGKVMSAYVPETNKFIVVELSNGTIDTLAFFDLRYIVEVEDSIIKLPNSFKYIIYKKCNPDDSVVYVGNNFYTKSDK